MVDPKLKEKPDGEMAIEAKHKPLPVKIETRIGSFIQDLSFTDPKKAKMAEKQLIKFGAKALPYLFDASMNTKKDELAQRSAKVIESMGVIALPFLIVKLEDPDEKYNAFYIANKILSKEVPINKYTRICIHLLAENIQSSTDKTAREFSESLLLGGTPGTIPLIIKALFYWEESISKEAETALMILGSKSAEALIDGFVFGNDFSYKRAERILERLDKRVTTSIVERCMEEKRVYANFDALYSTENYPETDEEELRQKVHMAYKKERNIDIERLNELYLVVANISNINDVCLSFAWKISRTFDPSFEPKNPREKKEKAQQESRLDTLRGILEDKYKMYQDGADLVGRNAFLKAEIARSSNSRYKRVLQELIDE